MVAECPSVKTSHAFPTVLQGFWWDKMLPSSYQGHVRAILVITVNFDFDHLVKLSYRETFFLPVAYYIVGKEFTMHNLFKESICSTSFRVLYINYLEVCMGELSHLPFMDSNLITCVAQYGLPVLLKFKLWPKTNLQVFLYWLQLMPVGVNKGESHLEPLLLLLCALSARRVGVARLSFQC